MFVIATDSAIARFEELDEGWEMVWLGAMNVCAAF